MLCGSAREASALQLQFLAAAGCEAGADTQDQAVGIEAAVEALHAVLVQGTAVTAYSSRLRE